MTDDDEPGLRGGLRELADRDATGRLRVAELLSRARRRRNRRLVVYRATVLTALATSTAAVLAVVVLWDGPSKTNHATTVAPLTCAPEWIRGEVPPTGHLGISSTLLPGDPRAGLACQYSKSKLVGSVPLLGSRLDAVTEALHQPSASYPFRCPAPDGSGVIIEFGYDGAPDVHIEAFNQCPGLSNGALAGIAFRRDGLLPAALSPLLPAVGAAQPPTEPEPSSRP